jgi:hypothetical protein
VTSGLFAAYARMLKHTKIPRVREAAARAGAPGRTLTCD